ncbi:MAG: acylneuraminate cytidylyltransferase family protein [bacterium]|nr:acylneuraminate cytidylyltransferase family protein [bacterium]
MKILGFIGARGGSKGLKNKNTLDFAGKPLIQWSIETGLDSKFITDVVVSTDDEKIRSVAIAAGARAPFLRPAELAGDRSDVNDAIIHGIRWLRENENRDYDLVALLQPTQPLRTAKFVDQTIHDFIQSADLERDSLVAVTRAEAKLAYLMQARDGFVDFAIQRDRTPANRQELPEYYLPAGSIYIAPVERYLKQKSFYGDRTRFVEVDEATAADIDSAEDFENALRLYRSREVNR